MDGGANLPLISDYNRGVVLECIRLAGTISRVEIAELTGLSAATVSNIVRRLLEDELVADAGRGESTGGKPRTLLRLNPSARYAIGVLLDTDSIRYVMTDLSGAIVSHLPLEGDGPPTKPGTDTGRGSTSSETAHRQPRFERETPTAVIAQIARTVDRLIDVSGVDRARIVGVGVAAPGPIQHDKGVVMRPPNLAIWDEVPIRDELQALLHLPILVDNDATSSALGERWLARAGAPRNFAAIYMSNGVGVGLFINDEVYRGTSSNAGEIGHLTIYPGGDTCSCGRLGCLEAYSSPRGIVTRLRRELTTADLLAIGLPEEQQSVTDDFERLKAAAARGVANASAVIQRAADDLAIGVLSMVNLLDLELVVLSGEAFDGVESTFLDTIARSLQDQAFSRDLHPCRVEMSPMAADAGAVGAAALVMHSRYAPQIVGLRAGP